MHLLVFSRTNLEDWVQTPLDVGDAGLLECIDGRQIKRSGIVGRSVWIFNEHEVFGVGRQVARCMSLSARSSRLGRIIFFSVTSGFTDGLLSYRICAKKGMSVNLVYRFVQRPYELTYTPCSRLDVDTELPRRRN